MNFRATAIFRCPPKRRKLRQRPVFLQVQFFGHREALQRGCRSVDVVTGRHLFHVEIERFDTLAASSAPITVVCTQETPLFREASAASDGEVSFANLRETAGWSA
jgi:hypothetical protein